MLQELLIVLALILANGFFSGAEMAIVASRRGRLRQMAEQGDTRAATALELASNPDRFLPTVQIGITLVGTLAAAYGGDRLVGDVAEWIKAHAPPPIAAASQTIALTLFVMLLSFVTLLLGELVPKRLALRRAESFARHGAVPARRPQAGGPDRIRRRHRAPPRGRPGRGCLGGIRNRRGHRGAQAG
jgi:putative hemolysin